MAKKSMINREKKREKTVQKFAAKRAVLKAQIRDLNLSDDERWAAQVKFQKLPRNASPTRQVRRCVLHCHILSLLITSLTSQARGYHRASLPHATSVELNQTGDIPREGDPSRHNA